MSVACPSAGRVILLNRYYAPDHSATSQYLTDLSEYLAAEGWSVDVICSRQRYLDADADLPTDECLNGVRVHRVRGSRFGRDRLLGRALDYLAFYYFAALALWRLCDKGDVVVAKTDPPLLSVPVAWVCRLRGARQVNWLQDLFPEVAAAFGLGLARGLPGRLLRGLRNRSLRAAACNVVIGEPMARRLRSEGIPAERIAVIPNWADTDGIWPLPHADNPLRRSWQLEDRLVLLYSGNLGRAHDLSPLLQAMQQLPAERFQLLFVGGGPGQPALKAAVRELGLKNVQWQPYQPREQLAQSLSVGDLHLVALKPEMESLIVPSKFAGALAAGRPVLFFGARDGQLAEWVLNWRCGWHAADTADALAEQIRDIAEQINTALFDHCRQVAEWQLGRSNLLRQWQDVLIKL